jgi:hypothetical protein
VPQETNRKESAAKTAGSFLMHGLRHNGMAAERNMMISFPASFGAGERHPAIQKKNAQDNDIICMHCLTDSSYLDKKQVLNTVA